MDFLILQLPGFLWNPNVATALTEPSLFLAVQTYVPESSLEKFPMLNIPFLTEDLPFGKPKNARIQVISEGG